MVVVELMVAKVLVAIGDHDRIENLLLLLLLFNHPDAVGCLYTVDFANDLMRSSMDSNVWDTH